MDLVQNFINLQDDEETIYNPKTKKLEIKNQPNYFSHVFTN